jgi:hypothetical protein
LLKDDEFRASERERGGSEEERLNSKRTVAAK